MNEHSVLLRYSKISSGVIHCQDKYTQQPCCYITNNKTPNTPLPWIKQPGTISQ